MIPEIGKYHLVAELARGGMGVVHLAAVQGPAGFQKLLVVKELKTELATDEAYVSMFLDEARLAARLAHPNIVQTIEVGSEGQRHYMVMEFLDGRSLYRTIRRFRDHGAFPLAAHLRVLGEMLLGLQYAHDLTDIGGQPLGIVHRDVSPLNVIVTFDGQAKLLDFGIAKSVDSSLETKTGTLKGRIAYMAPEQAWGTKVDRRADVYSAGVMLWEAIAGRRLWPGMNDVQILAHLLREGPPRLRSVRPDCPHDLEAICERALAKRPVDRYATAHEMFEDLEAHLATRADAMTMRDVGALVAREFAEERRRMNGLLEETLLRVRGGPRSGVMPTLEVHVRGTPSGALPPQDEPTLGPSLSRIALTPSRNVPSITVPPATSTQSLMPEDVGPARWGSRRAALVGWITAAILSVIALALVAGQRAGAPASAAPQPVPAAAPIAPPAAREAPAFIDLVVRVTPPTAEVSVDGASSPSPLRARFPRDALVHHVSATAEGYEPKALDVTFANDASIDMSLDRRPPPAARNPPPGGPHPGRHVSGAPQAQPSPAGSDAPSPPAAATAPAPQHPDVSPGGGHAPLRPILTSNPYGTP